MGDQPAIVEDQVTIWFDDTLPSLDIPNYMTVDTYQVDKALMDWYRRAEKLWYSDRENEQYDRILWRAQQAIYRVTGHQSLNK